MKGAGREELSRWQLMVLKPIPGHATLWHGASSAPLNIARPTASHTGARAMRSSSRSTSGIPASASLDSTTPPPMQRSSPSSTARYIALPLRGDKDHWATGFWAVPPSALLPRSPYLPLRRIRRVLWYRRIPPRWRGAGETPRSPIPGSCLPPPTGVFSTVTVPVGPSQALPVLSAGRGRLLFPARGPIPRRPSCRWR